VAEKKSDEAVEKLFEAVRQDVSMNTVTMINILVENNVLTLEQAIDSYRLGTERAFGYLRKLAVKRAATAEQQSGRDSG
jgi:hypothetical protein